MVDMNIPSGKQRMDSW